jgi:hypothetical protein
MIIAMKNSQPFELNEKNETQYLFEFMKDIDDRDNGKSLSKSLLDFLKEDSIELGDLFD